MWLALLGFHLVGSVGFNLILRKSVVAKIDQFSLATIMQTGIAIPTLILVVAHPPAISTFVGLDYLWLACAIGFGVALQVVNVKALQYLEASVFSILYNLRLIITTALGILCLGENVVWLRIAGGILILLAIFIVKQQGSHALRVQGIAWGITAAVVLSFLNLFEKLLVNSIGFLNYFPIMILGSAVIMWAYLVLKKRNFDHSLLGRPPMIQLMVLRAMSSYGFSGALGTGALLSVANYISGMSVIFIVLLGAILLNERDYLGRKVVATVVAVLGLTIVLVASL